jgi:acyl-CoA hydrolase
MTRTAELRSLVRPGMRIAFSDGHGLAMGALAELTSIARTVGGVRLVLGWCPVEVPGFDPTAFADVRSMMGGYGLRKFIDAGSVHYVHVRLGATPALIHGPLKPDLVVASVVHDGDGYRFGNDVGWSRAAIDAGAVIAAVVADAFPHSEQGPPIPTEQLVLIGRHDDRPIVAPPPKLGDDHRALGRHVASLIDEGVRVQFGPGPISQAVFDALECPVRIDSGLLTDSLLTLVERGLLIGEPTAGYLSGDGIYDWADTRPVLHGVEFTHDLTRLATGLPLVAINVALQVDLDGQVNVERIGASTVGGLGGHPDFCTAAQRSPHGLSLVCVPTSFGGRSTLVERLDAPVTTARNDIDMFVTERGVLDIRGLDAAEVRRGLQTMWGQGAP